MATKKKTDEQEPVAAPVTSVGVSELAAAMTAAINAAKPVEKKNPTNRKKGDPWQTKDGTPKLKLKRKMHQHGIPVDPDLLTNEQIDLCNKLKTGTFMEGHVKVYRRRDKGLDIDYPVRTAAQRLKLVNQFGIRDFTELLARCISEAQNPQAFITAEED